MNISPQNVIPGFHAVMDTLCYNPTQIKTIYLIKGNRSHRIEKIIKIARLKDVPVHFFNPSDLPPSFNRLSHQGIIALLHEFQYRSLNDIIADVSRKHGRGLLIAVDHITDEGNLGSIMRTAGFFKADGLIIPKDRSARISARVLKSASGIHNRLPVVRVVNLARCLTTLSKNGFWIIGTGTQGKSVYKFDWDMDIVLVLGNEQKGISPSIKRICHDMVGIPSPNNVDSLNVAVAGGVILSEIYRQRTCLS